MTIIYGIINFLIKTNRSEQKKLGITCRYISSFTKEEEIQNSKNLFIAYQKTWQKCFEKFSKDEVMKYIVAINMSLSSENYHDVVYRPKKTTALERFPLFNLQ